MSNRPISPVTFIGNPNITLEELGNNLSAINASNIWISPILNRDLGAFEPSPEFLYDGLLAYADGTNWNPGSGKGYYRYNLATTAWVAVGSGGGSTTVFPILASPDGNYWAVKLDNNGQLYVEPTTVPTTYVLTAPDTSTWNLAVDNSGQLTATKV
jgi:hypothetical protein